MENKTHNILVVENDPFSQKVIKVILSEYAISFCQSGEDMELQLKEANFDLIIMDIGLGGPKHGLDLVRDLRTKNKYAKIPVIIATSYVNVFNESDAVKAGAQVFITKPFDQEELRQTVSKLLSTS